MLPMDLASGVVATAPRNQPLRVQSVVRCHRQILNGRRAGIAAAARVITTPPSSLLWLRSLHRSRLAALHRKGSSLQGPRHSGGWIAMTPWRRSLVTFLSLHHGLGSVSRLFGRAAFHNLCWQPRTPRCLHRCRLRTRDKSISRAVWQHRVSPTALQGAAVAPGRCPHPGAPRANLSLWEHLPSTSAEAVVCLRSPQETCNGVAPDQCLSTVP